MNITKFTLKKLNWLFHQPGFKMNSIKTLYRVLSWEIIRKKKKRIPFVFDSNLNIYLYPDDGVARLTYYFGYHEPLIFRFLESFLLKGMTYCDIGANIGLYSIFAAKRIGNDGKVIAFEPQTKTYYRFLENTGL